MQHAKLAFPDDAQATNHGLNPRSDLMDDLSTPLSDDPSSGSDLSAGAIAGIVIGSIFGAVVLIGVVFLVRHFFCRFPGGSQIPTDKFTVSYTRSDLNATTLDRNASSAVDLQLGQVTEFRGSGRDGVTTSSPSLPSLKLNADTTDAADETQSYNAIEINFPDSDEFSNQNPTTDSTLHSQSSKIGIDNPCFDSEDDKPSLLSVPTPTKSQIPSISISQPNSRNNSPTSSASKLSASYAQERGNLIRRSYHLDRNVASAIAAQRNRETTSADIFNGSEFPSNRNDDVIIVFTARTVL